MKLFKWSIAAIPAFLLLCVLCWFVYTRFLMPVYRMDGELLTYGGTTYVRQDRTSVDDEENLGRTVGIGVEGKRTITDLIWPFWVMEYQSDASHNSLFIRGLMDSGGKYIKVKDGK